MRSAEWSFADDHPVTTMVTGNAGREPRGSREGPRGACRAGLFDTSGV
jgi:hypothetical protein